MKHKILNAALCASLAASLLAGAPASASTDLTEEENIRIGVAIWSSTDSFGSQCKRILDEAAAALDVQIQYVDHGYAAGKVEQSVEQLSAYGGCPGIIVCASTDTQIKEAIETCEENGTYIAQFFGSVSEADNPDVYQSAVNSQYYVGAVHEDEFENGRRLADLLLEKGSRRIGLIGTEMTDDTWAARMEGASAAISDWNDANPASPAVISGTQYAGATSEGGSRAAQTLMDADADLDGLLAGGTELLQGALAAVERAEKTETVEVTGAGFISDLGTRLEKGTIAGATGGHYCDPLFAFLMVYRAIENGGSFAGNAEDVAVPYLLVASAEDYAAYERYFVNQLPYTREEILALAGASAEELKNTAAALSIESAAARLG